jgi:plastocyanin
LTSTVFEGRNMAHRTALYATITAVVLIAVVISANLTYYYFGSGGSGGTGSGGLSGNNIDVYSAEYGFGSTASNVGSPGPTITLTSGQTVTVSLHNVGKVAHNWAIVMDKTDGNANLAFSGAQIGSIQNPIASGVTQSINFTVGSAGSYYYICQIDGHVTLGMWGMVTVK